MNAVAARARGITPRRIHVLALAANGFNNEQIAERLGITPTTVNHHLQAIYGVLGARDRAHAVALAISYGYVRTKDVTPLPAPTRVIA